MVSGKREWGTLHAAAAEFHKLRGGAARPRPLSLKAAAAPTVLRWVRCVVKYRAKGKGGEQSARSIDVGGGGGEKGGKAVRGGRE